MKLVRKIRIITIFIHLAFSMVIFLCSESHNQNTLSSNAELKNQNKSTEKINLKTKIFLESKMLKHKKAAAAVKTFESIDEPEKKEETEAKPAEEPHPIKTEALTEKENNSKEMKAATSQSPVLFEGWVKYFKFSENINISMPKKFFRNGEYEEQMKLYPEVDYAAKNLKGEFDYIRSHDYFYLAAFKNLVSFFSSKHVNIVKYFIKFLSLFFYHF